MIPKGLDPLVKLRMAGRLPNDRVTVFVGDDWKLCDWSRYIETVAYPECVIRSCDNIKRLDLRPLVRLSVFVVAVKYDDRLAELFNRLKDFADFICVTVMEWGADDFGFDWMRHERPV